MRVCGVDEEPLLTNNGNSLGSGAENVCVRARYRSDGYYIIQERKYRCMQKGSHGQGGLVVASHVLRNDPINGGILG